jgi:hypothetical protein
MKESENPVFVFPRRKMPGKAFFEIPISTAYDFGGRVSPVTSGRIRVSEHDSVPLKEDPEMPKFIFAYLGGEYPSSPEEGHRHFQKYQAWLESLGDAVVSPAIPFKDTHTVRPDGTVSPGSMTAISGLSIVRLASMEEALAAAKACPFLEIKGALEVSELIEMSDSPANGGQSMN